MSTLTRAIIIATQAHEGQIDKGGNPYILHPLRLATKAPDDESRIVAVLHDVVEDSDISLRNLFEEGFSWDVVNAIDCLTHRKGESYDDYILRIKTNSLATTVKLLDLDDNRDLSRIPDPSNKDFERLKKYNWATNALLS